MQLYTYRFWYKLLLKIIYGEAMNIYDFDNTIFNGDSTAKFYIYCLKKHPKIICTFPVLIKAFVSFYILKKGTKTQFKEKMYTFLKYCNTESDVEDFWKTHINDIKDWYKSQQKYDDVIISASPVFLLETPCKMLGINCLIASRVDLHTGRYTGENCHGEEKVRRLFEEYGRDIRVDNFYSDSYSDTPLARLADNSFIVKGNSLQPWDFSKKSRKNCSAKL